MSLLSPSSMLLVAQVFIVLIAMMVTEATHQYHHRHHRVRHRFLEHHRGEDSSFHHHRHHRLHRRQHRHHNHHVAALNQLDISLEDGALDFEALSPEVQQVFPKAHPLVAKHLEAMGDGLKEVKHRENQAVSIRERIQEVQQEETEDMSKGVALRRVLAGATAGVHSRDQVLSTLQEQESRLRHQHDRVSAKLGEIMEPRIASVEQKLAKRRKSFAKTEEDMRRMDELVSQHKSHAMQQLEDRKSKFKTMGQMQAAIQEAEKRERVARATYEEASRRVSDEIEAYRFAQTRQRAIQSRGSEQKERIEKAEVAVSKTHTVFKVEGERIDAALGFSEAKLQKRIEYAKSQREKARHRFTLTQGRLREWQAKQRELAKEIVKLKEEYDNKHEDIGAYRDQLMTKAMKKAGEEATSKSDWAWDDWAWARNGELGSDQSMESIPADLMD